ncbi:MAG: type II toxin-antitoxin system HicB family antitoxin [Planctomycetes bacterium]|nr:type II toxin-antitoxin system HicB family antitoxin [Planctomycetota bacterium]
MRYLVVIEEGESSWAAHVPDLPGCVAVGESREEAVDLIHEAVELHLEDLRAQGQPVPQAASDGIFVEAGSA